tara:strand:+ start:4717 stop:5316 length:600 start_codon:yes stop_codon:yes gene_type:complete
MRRIETLQTRESRDKRNRTAIGVVLIVLMVSSTVGFIFAFHGGGLPGSNSDEIDYDFEYNDIGFFRSGSKLVFQVGNGVFETSLEPSEIESVEFNVFVNAEDFFNRPLYFVFDQREEVVEELERNLGSLALRYDDACLEDRECSDEEFVVKSCEDNVIVISESEEIKTYKEGNCIFLEGPKDMQMILADKLIYRALGIQ